MFEDNNCFVHSTTTNFCVAHAVKMTSGLYRLLACPSLSIQYANLAHSSTHIDINLLHHHLGHLSHDNFKQLVDKGMVQGVVSVGNRIDLCEACIHGKQHTHPFPPSMKLAHRKLDIIHSDVCGPLPSSIGGKCYFITFIDDHSQHVWIHFLQHKSEALAAFKEFKVMVENQTGLTIKVFHSDGGGE